MSVFRCPGIRYGFGGILDDDNRKLRVSLVSRNLSFLVTFTVFGCAGAVAVVRRNVCVPGRDAGVFLREWK